MVAGCDQKVTGGAPAMSYGGGSSSAYVDPANRRGKSEGKMSGRTVSSP